MTTHTPEAPHANHANEGTYFSVFIALALLTIAEVLITYIPAISTPVLLAIMMLKAWLVVSFFMHLRYDNRLFSWAFWICTVTAIAIIIFLRPLGYLPGDELRFPPTDPAAIVHGEK